MHDLIIRGGEVLDGTGAAAVRADVAIDADRITAVGDLADASAAREIDATGCVVTPGFIDLHTHFDAQVGWDPHLTSSSWHGVTTVLMGNCGVTFAPVAPEDRTTLAEMMESVEDIPRDAILGGLPWDWTTYPEYLDSVQRLAPALNVVGLVGHCAVRYHVMGERSLGDDVPTPAELDRMRGIAADAVAGGAVGFSTSRLLYHVVPDGRKVPGTWASPEEYLAVADGMNAAGGGIFQAVLDFDTRLLGELALLRTMAEAAGDVVFTAGPGNDASAGTRPAEMWDAYLSDVRANAGRITAIAMTRPSGSLMGLWQVPPVTGPAWHEVMQLPTLDARVAALRDPATRARLVDEGRARGLWYDPRYVHPLGDPAGAAVPDYDIVGGASVAELAEAAGVHPIELMIDRLIASEGRELFNVWLFHRNTAALGELLTLDAVSPGASDTGAHAGQICDADAPTHFLAYWVGERGLVSFAEGVHRLTQKAAKVLGLIDRGVLAAGAFADVNVIDRAALQTTYPTYVNDFPNGAGRLLVHANGYRATLVNGVVVSDAGETTGARPGRVLREFARS